MVSGRSAWRNLSSKLVYKSRYTRVYEDKVKLPDQTIIEYTRLWLPDFVVIVPVLEDNIVMINNYRYPVNRWCLELPAGFIDKGEKPEKAATRELEEETGYVSSELRCLGWHYPMSARGRQKAYTFLATDLKFGKVNRDKAEQQEICILPRNVVYSKLFDGEIKHSGTISALTFALSVFREEMKKKK